MKNYELYSRYYDLLYKDKDYSAEADYVARRIKSFSPKAKTILELGCGTGKHGVELEKKGLTVFSIDKSKEQIAQAKERGLDCAVADISRFRAKKKYDAAISLFHVMSYLTDNDSLISAFKNTHANLAKNGIFLFDVWYTPAVNAQKPENRIKEMKDERIMVTRTARPVIDTKNNLVNVHYTLNITDLKSGKTTEIEEDHIVRHFCYPEMGLLAELTGFKVLSAEELITGKAISEKTWGACFILRKM